VDLSEAAFLHLPKLLLSFCVFAENENSHIIEFNSKTTHVFPRVCSPEKEKIRKL